MTAEKHVKTKDPLFGWTATDRPLKIPTELFRPGIIDGDVDKYFCAGSGRRTYPDQIFDDKETQRSERDQRAGTR